MGTPAEEIKQGFEKIQNEFHTFKQENDARLKKIESKGTAGADVEEKINRHSEAIDELVEKLEKSQTILNRIATQPEQTVDSDKEVEKKMSTFMRSYMRKGDRALTEAMVKEHRELELKALSVGSDPDGGYLVRPEVSAMITKKIFESSPVRQFAAKMSISTDAFEEPADFDEPDASWAGEKSTRSETDTNQLSLLRIPTHEMYAKPKATQAILEDSAIDIEAWHAAKVAEKFARKEATAFISGSGVGQPRGIVSYTSGTAYGEVEQVNLGAATLPTADGLIALQHALFEAYQPNARWMCHRTIAKEIRKLKNGSGDYLWSLDGNLMDGWQQSLLGKPLHWASDLAESGAGNLGVLYGDFAQAYLIIDRVGIAVLRDPYSAKPYVEFYTRKRVGGGMRNFQAMKIGKFAT